MPFRFGPGWIANPSDMRIANPHYSTAGIPENGAEPADPKFRLKIKKPHYAVDSDVLNLPSQEGFRLEGSALAEA